MVRVIAGLARGRRLAAPPGDDVRPTADRTKEALFSILYPVLLDARVLDLYAGSGALGIEALSRGAAHATFVERHPRTIEVIRDNVALVGFEDRADIVTGDAPSVVARRGAADGGQFDVVVADPPYGIDEEVLTALLADLPAALADGAVVAIERGAKAPAPTWPEPDEHGGAFAVQEPRRYGSAALHLATWHAAEPQDA